MSIKVIKLVTFDATNTLLKFRIPPWQHYAETARDVGFRGTGDDLKPSLLNSYKIMWKKYPNFGKSNISWENWWKQVVNLTFEGKLSTKVDVDGLASRLIDEFKTSKCWCIAEGCERLINLLHVSGISVGIISNFDLRLIHILQDVGILSSFDFVLTSYEIGFSKPDKRLFEHALERCVRPVLPSESLHVGDDEYKDYNGARAAGWHAIMVTKNLKTAVLPASEHVFSSLEELTSAIELDKLRL